MDRSFEQVMELTSKVSSRTAFEDIECRALYDHLLKVRPGNIVVEVGCQLGRSSSIIAQLQPVVGYHALHIDPYTDQPDYLNGWIDMMWKQGHREDHEWTLMCMRTEQAEWLLSRMGEFDLGFVDGDHEYPSVMTDFRLVGDRVRRGGYLLAHDVNNKGLPGVEKAVKEYIDARWHEIGIFGSLGVWFKR